MIWMGSKEYVENLWKTCGKPVENWKEFVDNFSTMWKCG